MPTYNTEPQFARDFASLSKAHARAFLRAKNRFVACLRAGRPPDPGLGVHEMAGHPGIFEFRYSRTGRATFSYGTSARDDTAHVIWRRVGTHAIYEHP